MKTSLKTEKRSYTSCGADSYIYKVFIPRHISLYAKKLPVTPPHNCISKEQSIFEVRNSIAARLLIRWNFQYFLVHLMGDTELAQIIYIFQTGNAHI